MIAFFPTQGSRLRVGYIRAFDGQNEVDVSFRKNWQFGNGPGVWTFISETGRALSFQYARPIRSADEWGARRARWYVAPYLRHFYNKPDGGSVREVGMTAGVQFETHSFGIVHFYLLASGVAVAGGQLRRLVGVLLLSTLGVFWRAAVAGELTPFSDGTRLGARLKNLSLPASFRKDLRSGLTNRLLLRVELVAESQILETQTIELAVKYDLWDENFRVTMDAGQGMTTESVLASEQQVLAFLSDVPLPGLFDMARLQRSQDHLLRGDALLNPIEQERMKMIRKWVSENSTQTPVERHAQRGGAGGRGHVWRSLQPYLRQVRRRRDRRGGLARFAALEDLPARVRAA